MTAADWNNAVKSNEHPSRMQIPYDLNTFKQLCQDYHTVIILQFLSNITQNLKRAVGTYLINYILSKKYEKFFI